METEIDWGSNPFAETLEMSMVKRLRDQFARAAGIEDEFGIDQPFSVLDPPPAEDWLYHNFPDRFSDRLGNKVLFAPHHKEFWAWIESIRPGKHLPAFFALWGRGGGKSSSTEAACAYVARHRLRKYGLYISGVQEQSDDHVSSVESLLGALGMERALGKYGQSKGWRRNRLRTENFTLDSLGLDTAAGRGLKWDEIRPDFIVIDDVDDANDGPSVIRRKLRALTRKILPAGSDDVAVVGVQNIPNNDGIFAQIADGRADFLMDRIVSGPFPVLQDFECETYFDEASGSNKYRITKGVPAWVGQGFAQCQRLLNLIGLSSFRVECLFERELIGNVQFQRGWFKIVDDWPRDAEVVRYWDQAATETKKPGDDPDWTAGGKMAMKGGQFWILDLQHERGTPLSIEALTKTTAELDGKGVNVIIEEEGGASGKNNTVHYQTAVLPGFTVRGDRPTGSKEVRARPFSSAAEAGNVFLVRGPWNKVLLDELEGMTGHDDIRDCLSGAHNALTAPPKKKRAGTWGR